MAKLSNMDRRCFLASGLALPLVDPSVSAPARQHRVLIGGDTDFAESYSFNDEGRRTTATAKYGYSHSLAMLAPLMRRAQHTVLNLETVFTRKRDLDGPKKEYRHWSDGERAGRQLRRHGVDAVSLANNHTLDYGARGLNDTFKALEKNGIQGFGAGSNEDEAAEPYIFSIPSQQGQPRRVAIFGMFEYRHSYDTRHGFYAEEDQAGANRLDIDALARQIRRQRREDPSLFVIAFPHWGGNYSWRTEEQAEMGRAMIEAGADMVIGHHGHCMQEVEPYRGKWILYGIGNFMFNSPGRFDRSPDILPYGLAVELIFDTGTAAYPDIHLYPILSDNQVTRYQPRPANSRHSRIAFEALRARVSPDLRDRLSLEADRIGRFIKLKA